MPLFVKILRDAANQEKLQSLDSLASILCSFNPEHYDNIETVNVALIFIHVHIRILQHLLNSSGNCIQDYTSERWRIIFAVAEQIDKLSSFCLKQNPEIQKAIELKRTLNCMKKKKNMPLLWVAYAEKLSNLVNDLMSEYLSGQVICDLPKDEVVGFSAILPQLTEFFQTKSDSHEHTLDSARVSEKIQEILFRAKSFKSQCVEDPCRLISDWQNALKSLNLFSTDGLFRITTPTQTEPICEPQKQVYNLGALPSSSSNFYVRLPSIPLNLLDGVSTPSDSPNGSPMIQFKGLLCLPEDCSSSENPLDESYVSASTVSRARIPWTLSESLTLWHEAHAVDRPSWARIWKLRFQHTRRTSVDLKDRWRVITRNQHLQDHLRKVYSRWLDTQQNISNFTANCSTDVLGKRSKNR